MATEHAYLHRFIDVKFIFDSARLGLSSSVSILSNSPNSRCRPSSCLLAVLAMFLAIFSPVVLTLEESEKAAIFQVHNQNNFTSSPGLLG